MFVLAIEHSGPQRASFKDGESGIGTDGGLGAGSDGTVPKELAGERAFPKSAADPPIMRESVAFRCRR